MSGFKAEKNYSGGFRTGGRACRLRAMFPCALSYVRLRPGIQSGLVTVSSGKYPEEKR